MYIFLGFFFLSWLFYTVFFFRLNKELVFFLKMLTSALLFAYALIAAFRSGDPDYSSFVIVAIGLGVLGDLFLGLQRIDRKRKHLHLLLGIASFFSGHVFYCLAFQKYARLPYYVCLPLAVIIMLISLVFIQRKQFNLGKAKFFSLAYVFISSLFLILAFGTLKSGFHIFSIFAAFGALAFSASDFVLAFLYFRSVKKYRLLKYINIVLYYLGQALLVSTVLLV